MSAKKLYLRSFGCQMNDYDSNRIVDLLGEAMQLEKTDDLNEADVVVLNTCSIREKAQEKVFSDLGRIREAKRDRPDMMIAVGGCVAWTADDASFAGNARRACSNRQAAG